MGLLGAVVVAIAVVGGLAYVAQVLSARSKERDVWDYLRELVADRWGPVRYAGRAFVVVDDGVDVRVAIEDLQREDAPHRWKHLQARFGVTARPTFGSLPELAEGSLRALERAGLALSDRAFPTIPAEVRLSIRTGPEDIVITGRGELETIALAIALAATLATTPQRALSAAARARGLEVVGAAVDLGDGVELSAAGGLRLRRANVRSEASLDALVAARADAASHARLVELTAKLGDRAEVGREHVDVVLRFDASPSDVAEAAEMLGLLFDRASGYRA